MGEVGEFAVKVESLRSAGIGVVVEVDGRSLVAPELEGTVVGRGIAQHEGVVAEAFQRPCGTAVGRGGEREPQSAVGQPLQIFARGTVAQCHLSVRLRLEGPNDQRLGAGDLGLEARTVLVGDGFLVRRNRG